VFSVIATRSLKLLDASGGQSPVTIEIGAPYPFPDDTGYRCPIRVVGLGEDTVREIGGIDAVQALLLALRFLETTLPAFAQEAGARLVWEDDSEDLGLTSP
jgi:hypothetical protein